jgi:TPR repeat protein
VRLAAEKKESAKLADAKKKEEATRLAAEEAKKKEAVAAAKAAEEAKKREEAARLAAEEAKKKEAAAAAAKAAEDQKRQQVAAVTAKPAEETKRVNGRELFARASELESQGKVAEAVKLYVAAANADHGPSAKKLGDIYSGGKGDVSQDYTTSLRWYAKARALGEKVQVKGR